LFPVPRAIESSDRVEETPMGGSIANKDRLTTTIMTGVTCLNIIAGLTFNEDIGLRLRHSETYIKKPLSNQSGFFVVLI
jgi:hypothetical protein